MGNRESEEGTRKPARGSPLAGLVTRGCEPGGRCVPVRSEKFIPVSRFLRWRLRIVHWMRLYV